jgi:hypothetical protein
MKQRYDVDGLTARQATFVRLFDGNWQGTAKRSGYKAPVRAAERLKKSKAVVAAIEHCTAEADEKAQLSKDEVILRLAQYFRGSDVQVSLQAIDRLIKLHPNWTNDPIAVGGFGLSIHIGPKKDEQSGGPTADSPRA